MDELYMKRALQLAQQGLGFVSPNPMVGAVVVHDGKVVGEGYHRAFGGPHAEVHAIEAVEDKSILNKCTLYVSLEPCSHHGKTPPCTDLIQTSGIPRVVVACLDPNPVVAGRGIQKLKDSGIDVTVGLLESEARTLNKRFFTNQLHKRPYIILKWAETADGFIAHKDRTPAKISSFESDLLVHQWRKEEDAILVGRKTVLSDDPLLTVRHTSGRNPVRVLLDPKHALQRHHKVFEHTSKVIVLNQKLQHTDHHVFFEWIPGDQNFLSQGIHHLLSHSIGSVLVEGGRYTLESLFTEGLWDECRVIRSSKTLVEGVPSPHGQWRINRSVSFGGDEILFGSRA